MKRFAIGLIAATFVLTALAGPTLAKPAMKAKAKTAASMKCPYCGMTMTTHKSAKMPVPVKIKGVTYYCCTTCHPAPKKSAAKKTM
jgi:hypothetical protein